MKIRTRIFETLKGASGCFTALGVVACLSGHALAQQTPVFSSAFMDGKSGQVWKLDAGDPAYGFLKMSEEDHGIAFEGPTSDRMTTEWNVGVQPFEFWFDVDLSGGTDQAWSYAGVAVAISSAPIEEMTSDDIAFFTSICRTGLTSAIKQGPFDEKDVNQASGATGSRVIGGLFSLNQTGQGGEWFSVQMPKRVLAGMKMRVRMQRLSENRVRFEYYNSVGDFSKPWWVGESIIPPSSGGVRTYENKELRERELKYVTIYGQGGGGVEAKPEQRLTGVLSNFQGWAGEMDVRPLIKGYEAGPAGLVNGTAFLINGENFSADTKVLINGKENATQVVSPTQLQVTASGLNASGPNQILVRGGNGIFRTMDEPVFAGLQLARVEPREALPAGGEIVTLIGGGFTASTRVQFNGKDVSLVGTPTSGSMQVKVPAGEKGLAKITATSGTSQFEGEPVFAYSPHPFVFFKDQAELAAKRTQFNDPEFAAYKKAILGEAAKFDGSKADLGQLSAALITNAIAYSLTEEQKYLDVVMKCYDVQFSGSGGLPSKIFNFPGSLRQNLRIGPFTPVQVTGFAYVYDVLFDKLSPEQRATIVKYLDYHYEDYADRIKANDWYFANNPSNTIPVANGACGTNALPLLYSTPQVEETVTQSAANIDTYYKGITEDGACIEGSLYWAFATSQQLTFGRLLENVFGSDMKMLSQPNLSHMNDFMALMLGGDGKMFSFNDTQPWLNGMVPGAFAGSRYDQPLMRWTSDELARRIANEEVEADALGGAYPFMAFMLRDTKPVVEKVPDLPTLLTLNSVNWGVMRSSPQAYGSGLVVGIKGVGGEQTHHCQEDAGSFVLQSRGEPFLIDPGYYQGTAMEHSLPLSGEVVKVDALAGRNAGGEARTENPQGATFEVKAPAPLFDVWEKGQLRSISVDSSKAYKNGAQVQRNFVLVGDKGLVILDNVQPTNPEDPIASFLQAGFPAKALPDNQGFRIEGKTSDLIGLFDGPKAEAIFIEPKKFLNEWIFDKLGVQWFRIESQYAYDAATPRVTVLLPADKGAEAPKVDIKRSGNQITVLIPGAPAVKFESAEGKWKAVEPSA